jgi:3-oxo-5-alpha-steroid 4-dehydrogenase 1
MGKTSIESKFNLPGKWAWFTMEAPGFITLLCIMFTLPKQLGLESLPTTNWVMAGMFTVHYLYRAIISPLFLNPSMSPIHPIMWVSALCFQLMNAISIGGWLAGYGPTTTQDWAGRLYTIEIGMILWGWGLLLNMYHDDDLREIRRAATRKQRKDAEEKAKKEGKSVDQVLQTNGVAKVYMLPKNGLFHFVLFPHYLCEWVEWFGFWMVGGIKEFTPGRSFLLNEIFAMLPRAVQGWHWYVEKFGRDKVGKRKAVIPGLI